MGSTLSGRSPMPVRKADIAKMLTAFDEPKRRSLDVPARHELDVVDSDLYPRHISTGTSRKQSPVG